MSNEKSPFGSYAILENIRMEFADEPEYWWEIKPPTAGDELALTRYMSTGKATYTAEGGMVTEGGPSWLDILFFQIATLFGGTNIPADSKKSVSDGGKPFISEKSTVSVNQERLKNMPMEMISEIADAIAEHVPGWGPKNPLSRKNQKED